MEMEMVDRRFDEAVSAANEGRLAVDSGTSLERLAAAASALEQLVERMRGQDIESQAAVERMVATAEARRASELERRLETAETELAELRAKAAGVSERPAAKATLVQRKTVPASVTNLLAKQGISLESMSGESMQAGSLDAALSSLSMEQRIAVKAQLLRAGVLSHA